MSLFKSIGKMFSKIGNALSKLGNLIKDPLKLVMLALTIITLQPYLAAFMMSVGGLGAGALVFGLSLEVFCYLSLSLLAAISYMADWETVLTLMSLAATAATFYKLCFSFDSFYASDSWFKKLFPSVLEWMNESLTNRLFLTSVWFFLEISLVNSVESDTSYLTAVADTYDATVEAVAELGSSVASSTADGFGSFLSGVFSSSGLLSLALTAGGVYLAYKFISSDSNVVVVKPQTVKE